MTNKTLERGHKRSIPAGSDKVVAKQVPKEKYPYYSKLRTEALPPEFSTSQNSMTPLPQTQTTLGGSGLDDEIVVADNAVIDKEEESNSSVDEGDLDEDGEDETENETKTGTRSTSSS